MTTLIDKLLEKREHTELWLEFYSGAQLQKSFSYNDIYQTAIEKAGILFHHAQGEVVLIEGNNDFEFITNFFAVQMAGLTPVPVTTSLWITEEYYKSIIDSIILSTEATTFLASHKSSAIIQRNDIQYFYPTDWGQLQTYSDFEPIVPQPTDTAFIQFSSGSTGNPKGVVLTHANVLANLEQIKNAVHSDQGDNRVVTWLPVHHDMGLIGGFLVPFLHGYKCAMMSPYDFAVNPARWLKVISKTKGNLIVAPNSGYHLCNKRVKENTVEKLNLSSVRVALCGAEPINLNTMDQFCRKFAAAGFQASAISPCYGMAENTLAISFAMGSELKVEFIKKEDLYENKMAIPLYGQDIEDEDTVVFVSCGKPLKDIEVMILDEKNYELEARQVGEIIVKSPSTCQGYFNRPDLNEELFIDGYLRTGDLGYISDGEIFITGRKKDIIILNGLNINAEEIESQAIKNPHVRAGRVVALAAYCEKNDSEEIAIIVETKPHLRYLQPGARALMRTSLRKTISRFINISEEQIHIVAPGTIQKTTSGKVKRNKMKEMLEQDQLNEEHFAQDFFQYKLKENTIKANLIIDDVAGGVRKRISKILPW